MDKLTKIKKILKKTVLNREVLRYNIFMNHHLSLIIYLDK